MNDKDMRIQNAINYFEKGYNCSQAVFMAYSDLYGIEPEMAAKLASSFGGGMGRLREVCGALTGAFLTLSLHYPANDITNKVAKTTNYEAVQRTAKAFKTELGSYICANLLEIKQEPENPESSERTAAYYHLRPCARCVAVAAEIVGKEIEK
jgi:C_GCAxxG_C_C family probable redox protein